MRSISLPVEHYAASWCANVRPHEEIDALGKRFVETHDRDALLEICRAFEGEESRRGDPIMTYRSGINPESLTPSSTWSLIAVSICACCAAVVTSRWYREENEKKERLLGENGLFPRSFSKGMGTSSGLHTTCRNGFGSTCSPGLLNTPPTSNAKAVSILSKTGGKPEPTTVLTDRTMMVTIPLWSRLFMRRVKVEIRAME